MSATILPLFWQLASSKPEERHSSCASLVKELVSEQAALDITVAVPATSSDFSASVKDPASTTDEEGLSVDEEIKKSNASNVFYALVRLVKGLASPRESSRLGFSVALTELLSKLDTVSPRQVIVLILKHSTPHGNIKGQEERDLLFARLFGIQALVQSNLLFSPTSSSLADFERALEILINLRNRKKWLAESAAWVVVQALRNLGAVDNLEWKEEALRWVARRFLDKKDLTPEKLAIVLTLQTVDQSVNLTSYIVPPLKNAHPLSAANLSVVGVILKDATPPDSEQEQGLTKGSSGSWKAQLHFVWEIILDTYYPSSKPTFASASTSDLAPFPDFFRQVVDEALFAIASSPERKSWGFQVFQRALVRVPQEVAPQLFTPNFMRTWINHLAGSDRLLHKAAMLTASVVQQVVERDPHTGFALVSQLVGKHGSQRFDDITRTKTVEQSLARLDVAGVRSYIEHLEKLACSAVGTAASSSKAVNAGDVNLEPQRKWAFDQLHSLVRNTSIPKNDECVMDVLRFFALHGYVDMKKTAKSDKLFSVPTPPFTASLKAACRSRFLSCLSDLNDQTVGPSRSLAVSGESDRQPQHQSRATGFAASGRNWLSLGQELVRDLEADGKHYTPVIQRGKEAESRKRKAFEALEQVNKRDQKLTGKEEGVASKNVQEKLHALRMLLLATILVTHEEEEDSVDILEPVVDAVGQLLDAEPSNAAGNMDEDEGPEATPMEVLVDVLISLMERPSAFLRSVAGHVFGAFASDLNTEALALLLGQLQGADEDEAQDPAEDDGMEVDREAAEDDETSATSETDEDDGDDAVDDTAVDPLLRSQVLEALKDTGMAELEAESDEDSEDNDDASDTGSDVSNMDDEQMMRLDDKLGEIFRLQSKKRGGDGRRDSIAFQNKILDLLDIFARKVTPTSPLLLQLVQPLFTFASSILTAPNVQTDKLDRQVAQRARGLLVNRICQMRLTGQNVRQSDGADWMDDLPIVLEEAHVLARSASSGEASALASSVNVLLTGAQLLVASGDDDLLDTTTPREVVRPSKVLLDLYVDTLDDFARRKASAIKPTFIVDAFRRYPRLGWTMRSQLLTSAAGEADGDADKKAVPAYRQVQVMGMLHTALQGVVMNLSLFSKKERTDLANFFSAVHSKLAAIVVAAAKDSDNGSNGGATGMNATRLKDVIKCDLQIVRLATRLVSNSAAADGAKMEIQTLCPPDPVKKMMGAVEESTRFGASKSLLDLCRQISSIIEKDGGSKSKSKGAGVKEKRKRDGDVDMMGDEETRKQKKVSKSGKGKTKGSNSSNGR